MSERPALRCFVGRPAKDGRAFEFEIELVHIEEAAKRFLEGWWIVGPDPHDEQALDAWIKEAQWSSHVDPGDEDDGHD